MFASDLPKKEDKSMKILIGYDGSVSADAAIEDLRRAGLPEVAEARVLCVADGESLSIETTVAAIDGSWRSKLAEAEALAEKARERVRLLFPNWTVCSEALWGSAAKVILDTCECWHPDLLVVGSHGRSRVARLFLGSVSLELIQKASCAVRVERRGAPADRRGPIRIVIGTDGSPEADTVIRVVCSRQWPRGTEAQVVSVLQSLVPVTTLLEANTYAQEPAYSVIREADERMRFRLTNIAGEAANALCRAGIAANHSVIDGDPREVLLAEAERLDADAIFVGARGHGRMEQLLLGSVSSHVVTHAHCAVEVVRGRHD
jgi:nucleotide-binding universal stress UspA family protein